MADTRYEVMPGVKLTSSDVAFAAIANAQEISRVWMWDIGPERPVQPKRPPVPKGREGDPEFDLALIEFKEALADYEAALHTHKRLKVEYADWEKRMGGAIMLPMWSVDARDALERDGRAVDEGRQTRRRYYIASRTRGYHGLPNEGLPEGHKSGHGHKENMRREREGQDGLMAARAADPVFGSEVVQ